MLRLVKRKHKETKKDICVKGPVEKNNKNESYKTELQNKEQIDRPAQIC